MKEKPQAFFVQLHTTSILYHPSRATTPLQPDCQSSWWGIQLLSSWMSGLICKIVFNALTGDELKFSGQSLALVHPLPLEGTHPPIDAWLIRVVVSIFNYSQIFSHVPGSWQNRIYISRSKISNALYSLLYYYTLVSNENRAFKIYASIFQFFITYSSINFFFVTVIQSWFFSLSHRKYNSGKYKWVLEVWWP